MLRPAAYVFFLVAALAGGCTPAHLPDGAGGDGGVPAVCGDRKVLGDEQCDDGNSTSGDGCDEDCQLEIPEGCGDDVLEEPEECDDGGNEAGDGCGPSCRREVCGNGIRDPGEACEDSNTVAGDGCSANCKSDESCGNGILDPDEACDDGDADDNDNCPRTCQPASCGDGFVQAGRESCDDENETPDDGCTACILDSCGDGETDEGEECDLGSANGTPGTTCFRSCIATELGLGDPIVTPLDPLGNISLEPLFLEGGDLDGDGRLDLLVADVSNSVVYTAHGLGDGAMWPPRMSFGSPNTTDVEVADVNGDGLLDALYPTGSDLGVMLGTAEGFGAEQRFSTAIDIGGQSPRAVAVAELTGDGKLDVVTANQSSDDVTLMTGDGEGGFTATARLATASGAAGDGPVDIAVADVTGDGTLDIVTANSASDDVAVLPGLGDGEFGAPEIFTTRVGAGGDGPVALAIADVSNDGRKDVVTANASSDDVTVLAGTAGGELAAPLRFVTLGGGGTKGDTPRDVAIGDVTGDGRRDVVVVTDSQDAVVLAAVGVGVAFQAPAYHPLDVGDAPETKSPRAVAITDLDRDGVADLVTANASSGDLTVLRGTGDGAFAAPVSYEIGNDFAATSPGGLAIADVNKDGDRDVVVAGSGAIAIAAGLGDGRLTRSIVLSTPASGHPALGDIDADGDLDLAIPRGQFLQIGIVGPTGQVTSRFSPSDNAQLVAAALGNVDGDALLESAAADASNARLVEYDASADGTPVSGAFPASGSTPVHVVLADVTGDGDLDLIAAVPSLDEVRIGAGDGAGSFATPAGVSTAESSSGQEPFFVTVTDVDGDGEADICTANTGSNDVTVLRGEGSGTFAEPIIAPAVFGADDAAVSMVRAGDLNGDGLVDLVTANPSRGTISVLIGFGDGGFAAPQSYDVGLRPQAIVVGDLDGDGTDDVAALTTGDNAVVVRLSEGLQ